MPRGNVYEDYYTDCLGKAWLKKDHNCGRSSVLKFLLPKGPMFTKMKKNSKLQSFEKREKWTGDIVNSYLLTKLGVDSVYGFRWTDSRTLDAHAMTLALLTQSSRAQNSVLTRKCPLQPCFSRCLLRQPPCLVPRLVDTQSRCHQHKLSSQTKTPWCYRLRALHRHEDHQTRNLQMKE